MTSRRPDENWEILELIGEYAAGELEGEEAREVERMISDTPDIARLTESYVRMLALLSAIGDENVEAPEAVIGYAVKRVYISAFIRQAERFTRSLIGDYVSAFVDYLRLKPTGD